mgnify:CR=1 FL=1
MAITIKDVRQYISLELTKAFDLMMDRRKKLVPWDCELVGE